MRLTSALLLATVGTASRTRPLNHRQYGEPTYGTDPLPATLPIPGCALDFILECDLNPPLSLGTGPGGTQYNWISFSGGTWTATWGHGTIEPGGQDYQFVLPDLSAKATTRYLLKTSDSNPAFIEIQSDGWITGPLDVMKRLNDTATRDSVPPSDYTFRLSVTMNTSDQRYDFVKTSLWVASAKKMTGKVIFEAYRVR